MIRSRGRGHCRGVDRNEVPFSKRQEHFVDVYMAGGGRSLACENHAEIHKVGTKPGSTGPSNKEVENKGKASNESLAIGSQTTIIDEVRDARGAAASYKSSPYRFKTNIFSTHVHDDRPVPSVKLEPSKSHISVQM